jgi:two-component system response regulator DesR
MIRAIVIEDQPDLAAALRETIEFSGDVEVVAVCHTLGVTAEVIAHLRPDVVVTDFRLPDGDAVDEFHKWRAASLGSRILVVSAWTDERSIRRARDAGAQGYLEKGPELDVLPDVIAAVAGGGTRWLDLDDAGTAPASGAEQLDAVARQVLDGIRDGRSTADLASELGTTEATVRRHVNQLLRTYGVRTRRALAAATGTQP